MILVLVSPSSLVLSANCLLAPSNSACNVLTPLVSPLSPNPLPKASDLPSRSPSLTTSRLPRLSLLRTRLATSRSLLIRLMPLEPSYLPTNSFCPSHSSPKASNLSPRPRNKSPLSPSPRANLRYRRPLALNRMTSAPRRLTRESSLLALGKRPSSLDNLSPKSPKSPPRLRKDRSR